MASPLSKLKPLKILWKHSSRLISATFEGRHTGEFISEPQIKRRKKLAHQLYTFCFAAVLAVILTHPAPNDANFRVLKTGEVAETDIVSPLSVELEPREISAPQKQLLSKNIPPIFDFDDTLVEMWLKRWENTFRSIRKEFYSGKKIPQRSNEFLETLRTRLLDGTGQAVMNQDILYLHNNHFSSVIERAFLAVGQRLTGKLIASSDLFPSYYSSGITVRQLNENLKETFVQDLTRIWSADQAQEFLTSQKSSVRDGRSERHPEVTALVGRLVPVNLQFNSEATNKRLNAVLASVKPPTTVVKAGQVLVRKGVRVNEAQAEVLENVRWQLSPLPMSKRVALTFGFMFLLLTVLFHLEISGKGFNALTLKDAMFFLFVTVGSLVATKYSLPYIRIVFTSLSLGAGYEYLIPISAGGIFIHLMMGREAAYTHALLIGILTGYLMGQDFFYAVWTFTMTASAVEVLRSCKQRTDLYKAGIWSGVIGGLLVGAYYWVQHLGFHRVEWWQIFLPAAYAAISGLIATMFTSSFIPIFESLFGYTTSLKLLELSNFNHPLLQALMLKAPGTYHHSVIVGSLAEIAADRVKANGLLARVSAYYHDIGKMNKPLYFIENQSPNNNPHDHLAPSMSAKILHSHVKNGVRMARDYQLGSSITNIIEQHHGTTLVSYFFNKAKKMENPEHDIAEESHFRYPGPKPQTREAAIVMLADACEAATRSIAEPTPAKIQTMVRNIINKRFLEEQFHECDLTFHDLQVIEEHFTRTLVSLYHHRIEYPGQRSALATPTGTTAPTAPNAALPQSESTSDEVKKPA